MEVIPMITSDEYRSICNEVLRQKHNLHLQDRMDLELFIDTKTLRDVSKYVNSMLQVTMKEDKVYKSFYGCEIHEVISNKTIIKVVDLSE